MSNYGNQDGNYSGYGNKFRVKQVEHRAGGVIYTQDTSDGSLYQVIISPFVTIDIDVNTEAHKDPNCVTFTDYEVAFAHIMSALWVMSDQSWALYRTPGGYRLFIDRRYGPATSFSKTVYHLFKADPVYLKFSQVAGIWQVRVSLKEARGDKWVARRECQSHYLRTPEFQDFIHFHDRCCFGASMP